MKIVFEDGVCEDIDTEVMTGSRYRLLATPLSSSSAARLGDVIELASEGDLWRFERVLDRSPLVTLEWAVTQDIAAAPMFHELLEHVRQIGGEWEQAFGGIVFVHLPPASVAEIESRIEELVKPMAGGCEP
jgi:hypothetical protein